MLVAIAYVAAVGLLLWVLRRQAARLFSELRNQAPAGVWEELGTPVSIRDAISDPAGRWVKFIRHRVYAGLFNPDLVRRVDAFRRAANIGLLVIAATGLVIVWLLVTASPV